jgi:uncharacterized protein (DUF2461 family)
MKSTITLLKNIPMKNHKEYKKRCLDLFQNFLNNPTDKDSLINGLKAIETELSKGRKTDKNLWFRFFKDVRFNNARRIY